MRRKRRLISLALALLLTQLSFPRVPLAGAEPESSISLPISSSQEETLSLQADAQQAPSMESSATPLDMPATDMPMVPPPKPITTLKVPNDVMVKKTKDKNPYKAKTIGDSSIGLFVRDLYIFRENPEEVSFPVFVLKMTPEKTAKLLKIEIIDSDETVRAKKDNIDEALSDLSDIASTPQEMLSTLDSSDEIKTKALYKRGYFGNLALNFREPILE